MPQLLPPGSCPEFLPWLPLLTEYKPNRPFPLQVAIYHGVLSQQRNPTNHKGEKYELRRFALLKECGGTEKQYGVSTPQRRHETPYL